MTLLRLQREDAATARFPGEYVHAIRKRGANQSFRDCNDKMALLLDLLPVDQDTSMLVMKLLELRTFAPRS